MKMLIRFSPILLISLFFLNVSVGYSKEEYSFRVLNGNYICNKIEYIFGFDPIEKYFNTYNKKLGKFSPTKVCNGECVKIKNSSQDEDHIFVNVKVAHQTKKEKQELINKMEKKCGPNKKHCLGEAWSGPIKIGYKIKGDKNLEKIIPSEKQFNTSCIHQKVNIVCGAEDEEITFEIWHKIRNAEYKNEFMKPIEVKIGMPLPDLNLSFYKGGYGVPDYKGSSLTFRSDGIGRFYCQKSIK